MSARSLMAMLCLLATGCVFADQSGQALPDAVYQSGDKHLGELSFHFRTGMNYVAVLARLTLLAGALLLLYRAWRAQTRQLAIVAVLVLGVLGSGWLFTSAAARVLKFKVAVDESGLVIAIPFQADVDEAWDQVYGVAVEGKELREGGSALYTEWSTMTLLLSGGRKVSVDLGELGVVQRSIFMRALEHRSGMKEQGLR